MTGEITSVQPPLQLSLGFHLPANATFEQFCTLDDNRITVAAIHQASQLQGDFNLLLWGQSASGLTHLLQACVHESQAPAAYLPLKDALDFAPAEILANLSSAALVCVDDLDAIAQHLVWEQAFLHLYNRIRDSGRYLVMAMHSLPQRTAFLLPDLQSRLNGSLVYRVHPLKTDHLAEALSLRARARGLAIPPKVIAYLAQRFGQTPKALFDAFDLVDGASLRLSQRMTLPWVKQQLISLP